MISYGRQSISQEDIDAVVDVLRSDRLTQGGAVNDFERSVADYCGAKHAVAVNSGTSALHIAYEALGVGEGDEVIMPALTFAATANAVKFLGGVPVFCDIDVDTMNIDTSKIEALITNKTKGIAPVHFSGKPCDMEKIHAIAKKHDLFVLEDACHALGSKYKGKRVGSLSDVTVFSFHPVKSITTGEGGMVTTDNDELFEKMNLLRTHGITKDSEKLEGESHGPWYHEMQILGYNYRITDIQCALGTSQMKRLDEFVEKRQKIADYYDEKLSDMEGIKLPINDKDNQSAWHLYVVRVPEERRKELFETFLENQIMPQVHYIPVYKHPYYQKIGYKDLKLEETEKYYWSAISLPIYSDLEAVDQDKVIKVLKSTLAQN